MTQVASQFGKVRVGTPDMGKVMGILKSQLAGKADFSALSTIVKEMLN
jgi:uncharacterized protein YqeY